MRLWDAQTGQPIGQPFSGNTSSVNSVAFSPDGRRIVSGSYGKTVRLWDVSPDGWLTLACTRLQYHPLLNQPKTITSDPEFLQVAQRARSVCEPKWRKNPVAISQSSTPQFPLLASLDRLWNSLSQLVDKLKIHG